MTCNEGEEWLRAWQVTAAATSGRLYCLIEFTPVEPEVLREDQVEWSGSSNEEQEYLIYL